MLHYRFCAGYNYPGYLPDGSAAFFTFEDAQEYIMDLMNTFADEDSMSCHPSFIDKIDKNYAEALAFFSNLFDDDEEEEWSFTFDCYDYYSNRLDKKICFWIARS